MAIYVFLGRIAYWLSKPIQWFLLSSQSRAYVLLVSEGKILVVQNWLGKGEWSLPGGGLRRKETPLQGIVREVYEETGIKISESAVVPLGESFTKYFIGGKRFYLFKLTLDRTVTIDMQKRELIDAKWCDSAELADMRCSAEVILALHSARTALV